MIGLDGPPQTKINVGEYFDTFRRTPMNDWHVENKADFENVGQWKRAWYYPVSGESMHEAVQRESIAARESAGILDASTLGKIDIQGSDASEFLNRVYTNAWSKLAIGKCRYGLMLNEDGMVFIGTSKGIISYKGQATEPKKTNKDIFVYPNPVTRGYDGPIAIKNLVEDANVKITDVNGNLVYETFADGGQAIWDGANFNGEKVKTGYYLVFASNDDGSETVVAKILIVGK